MVVAVVVGLVTGISISLDELPSPPSTPWSLADDSIVLTARKNASFANLF